MIPVKQLIDHIPEEGRYGDCARTCVAAILGVAPEEVEHWGAYAATGDPEAVAVMRRAWLDRHGVVEVRFPLPADTYPELRDVTRFMRKWNGAVEYLVVGCCDDVPHEVVGRGDMVVCDPRTGEPHMWGDGPPPLTAPYTDGWWHVGVFPCVR